MTSTARFPARVRASVDAVHRELVKFGAVGAAAYVVDVVTFNLLRSGLLDADGPLADKPLTAKTASVAAATVFAWLGNRYWTFRHRRQSSGSREFALFVTMNAAGLGIALGCLAFSHYVLGLTSALADNVAGNVVGLGLGTLFRFWAYRRFVFPDPGPRAGAAELVAELAAALPEVPPDQAALAAADRAVLHAVDLDDVPDGSDLRDPDPWARLP